MTDRERISTLLRQGLSADAIAAILDTDLTTVQDVQGGGSLPAAGGGGGLVVGPWVDLDYGDFPTALSDVYAVPVQAVPVEVEVDFMATTAASGGYGLRESADHSNWLATTTNSKHDGHEYLKCIVPAGMAVELFLTGGDPWFAAQVFQNVRYRTLG